MNFGRSIPSMFNSDISKPRKLGQFFLVMRTDVCQNSNSFENDLYRMSEELRSEPSKKNNNVLVPNDPQIIEAKIRKEKVFH